MLPARPVWFRLEFVAMRALEAELAEQEALQNGIAPPQSGDEEEARRRGLRIARPQYKDPPSERWIPAAGEVCSLLLVVGLLALHSARLSVCRHMHSFDRSRLALLVLQELDAEKSAAELDEEEKKEWGCQDPFEALIPLHVVAVTGALLLLMQVVWLCLRHPPISCARGGLSHFPTPTTICHRCLGA